MNFAWIIMCKVWSVGSCVYVETCLSAGSIPKHCTISAISMCYRCQLYYLYYLQISGLLMFWFVFFFAFVLCTLFQTTFYVFHVNLLIQINMTDYHARDLHWYWYLSWCSDISCEYFDFWWGLFSISYTFTHHILWHYTYHILGT